MKRRELTFRMRNAAMVCMTAVLLVACSRDEVSTMGDAASRDSVDLLQAKELGKRVGDFYVVKNSIVLKQEAIAQLDAFTSEELSFRVKPVQADSMDTGFIINSNSIAALTPNGFLVESLGSYEDSRGFHVKIKEIPVTAYILFGKAQGEIDLKDSPIEAKIYNISELRAERSAAPGLTTYDAILNSRSERSGQTIDPGNFLFNFPIVQLGANKGVIHLDLHPTFTYDIDINAFARRANLSFSTHFGVNNLGATFTLNQDLNAFQFNGDEFFIPLAIPIGPLIVNPYFSFSPYATLGANASGEMLFKSRGDILLAVENKGVSNVSGTVSYNWDVQRPELTELGVDTHLNYGLQTAAGIGLYGKTLYAQIQAKFGPDFVLYNDLLNKSSSLSVRVPAKAQASVGVSLVFLPVLKKTIVLLDKSLYTKEWIYDWDK